MIPIQQQSANLVYVDPFNFSHSSTHPLIHIQSKKQAMSQVSQQLYLSKVPRATYIMHNPFPQVAYINAIIFFCTADTSSSHLLKTPGCQCPVQSIASQPASQSGPPPLPKNLVRTMIHHQRHYDLSKHPIFSSPN